MNTRHAAALAAALAAVLATVVPARAQEAEPSDPLMDALVVELERSVENLRDKEEDPLYYLSYRIADQHSFSIRASYGALLPGTTSDLYGGRARVFDVSARVGNAQLDNTHQLRGEWDWGGGGSAAARLPIEDDPDAIRVAVWRATDSAYKGAVRRLIKVKTNKAVKVEAEDKADDFSVEEPHVSMGEKPDRVFDLEAWKERCKRLSALFKQHPLILDSSVGVTGDVGTTYFVDSDGARIRQPRRFVRIYFSGEVKADDGMDLSLFDSFEATTPEQLPTEKQVAAGIEKMIKTLLELRDAPVVEPFSGPAIIMNRSAAVFFHEIFGHRIEGHRQKDEDEGQTFTKKVGKSIMPEFMSVVDDPTLRRFADEVLNGFYEFDDEGVPAQKATLVEGGVFKGFVMSRSPIQDYPRSNGHGRAQPGRAPVSRQGNLVVSSANTIPFADLRARLIEAVKAADKPYGLMFKDISGGFTFTGRFMPQAFKVMPLVVYRVYPDGRPDELVRGVDLVGTPLASLEKIIATGDDYKVFNGYCGAESGWVPVSAVAPSLLVSEMEVEKKQKGFDRPPLLPPPLHPDADWPGGAGDMGDTGDGGEEDR